MKNQEFKKYKLPNSPGIYKFFGNKGELLYIGKATNLKDRVKSYFNKDLINMRGMFLVDMVTKAKKVDFIKTDSVLEALIMEANLIKKHQPKYNTKEKDNKSFNYVCITKDVIPKVLVVRGRSLEKHSYIINNVRMLKIFGPFTNGMQLREAMKIIRRIFPYIDESSSKKQNKKFYEQLGLSPLLEKEGVGGGEYKNNIKNLILFFEGKKKQILRNFKKDMMMYAKKKEFEKAGEIKKKIFALNHINDVALIKEDYSTSQIQKNFAAFPLGGTKNELLHSLSGSRSEIADVSLRTGDKGRHGQNFSVSAPLRIEAYDIAHMSGKNMVGVMTVVVGGEVAKNEYKKFIIKTQKNSNDTGALEEVLSRRFRHTEWGMPDLVVVDGSTAQINVAKRVLNRYQFKIPIVAVVKDDKHKARAIMGDGPPAGGLIKEYKKAILLANAEAHRFAITFYRQKSRKNMLK